MVFAIGDVDEWLGVNKPNILQILGLFLFLTYVIISKIINCNLEVRCEWWDVRSLQSFISRTYWGLSLLGHSHLSLLFYKFQFGNVDDFQFPLDFFKNLFTKKFYIDIIEPMKKTSVKNSRTLKSEYVWYPEKSINLCKRKCCTFF